MCILMDWVGWHLPGHIYESSFIVLICKRISWNNYTEPSATKRRRWWWGVAWLDSPFILLSGPARVLIHLPVIRILIHRSFLFPSHFVHFRNTALPVGWPLPSFYRSDCIITGRRGQSIMVILVKLKFISIDVRQIFEVLVVVLMLIFPGKYHYALCLLSTTQSHYLRAEKIIFGAFLGYVSHAHLHHNQD